MFLVRTKPRLLNVFGVESVFGPSVLEGRLVWPFSFHRISRVVLNVFIFYSDGRILSLLFQVSSLKLNLINIYAPNRVSDRKTFFEYLHLFFLSQGDCVIASDFNCVDRAIDIFHSSDFHSSDKSCLAALKADFSLVDVYRKLNPHGISYTWSNSGHTQASWLDRFFVSQPLFKNVNSNRVLPCTFSDHEFVCLELSLDGISSRRSSVWKFNSNLLADPDFRALISNLILAQKLKIASFPTLGDWWDNLKVLIRKSCISFSVRKWRAVNNSRNILTNQLIRAKRDFHAGVSRDESQIKSLEGAFSSLVLQEAEGAKIRSRAQWIEEGEKPTRFFFRLESKCAAKNSFVSLFDAFGAEKTSQSDIENILTAFYKNLFTKDPTIDMQIQTQIIDDLELSLTDHDRDSCEGAISAGELLFALKGLQTGKAPGSDGLPTEFYLAFWDDLGESLALVLNERFRLGILTDSQWESLLRLIHKKDDKRLPANWRPISLLNTDYKLASKVITERLKSVMASIVHSYQTCAVPGRSIFSNLQLVRDLLDMINKTDETGILVTLD